MMRTTSEPRFSYRIAASYSAKGQKLDPARNLYSYDPFLRTNRSARSKLERKNRPRSGQDAFFVNQVGDTSTVAFGVVDGVGGWQDSGVDPADFAHSLCEYMAGAANTYPEAMPQGPLRPKELMQFGYNRVAEDPDIEAGGSTACVATAESNGHVEIAK
jgi:protein phosphatase PTC7